MSEQAPTINVQEAFDPELRAAQQDMNIYATNRPIKDETGAVHDPANDHFINPTDYFDEQRTIHEKGSQTPYEEMSMPELARKLAEAEYHNDKTTAMNVSDVLVDKLADFEAKQATTRPKSGEDDNVQASDNIWNRVMGVKDKELARLQDGDKPKTAGRTKRKTRPTSPSSRTRTGSRVENGGEYEFRGPVPVHYGPDEHGRIQLGLAIDTPDTVLEWGEHLLTGDIRRRMIIAVDEDGNQYFVLGQNVYDVSSSVHSGSIDRTATVGDLPSMQIGQAWTWADGRTTGQIKHVEIAGEQVEAGTDVSGYREQPGGDPFLRVRRFLRDIAAAERRQQITDNQGLRGIRNRVRAMMARANAFLGLSLMGAGAHEHSDDEERRTRRKVIAGVTGAIALAGLAGAAYLEFKGAGVSQHLTPKGHTHGHGAGLYPTKHKYPTTETLHSGQNPWTMSEHQLHLEGIANPTNPQIDHEDMKMLRLNYKGKSTSQLLEIARHLRAGTRLRQPRV